MSENGASEAAGARLECHPEGLRAAGWRQGCRLSLGLFLEYLTVGNGSVIPRRTAHSSWALVAQDCDLAWNAVAGSDSLVELRPVFFDDPPSEWGIRSNRLKLDGSGAYIRADAPTLHVTPDVVLLAEHETCAHTSSARRLKTWLGLRYDRPAVPETSVDLARDLAERFRKKKNRPAEERAREILATFDEGADGVLEFGLVAVIPHREADADPSLVANTRDWLAGVALSVPSSLGLSTSVEAVRDDQVSLAYLEHAYSLDVSSVSWPGTRPGPVGATG